MSVKASVSLTDAQDAYARSLVAEGRYPSLSAVLQQGLDLLRRDIEWREAEIEGLRTLIAARRAGDFVPLDEAFGAVEAAVAARRGGAGV